jgi:hypothetical protein
MKKHSWEAKIEDRSDPILCHDQSVDAGNVASHVWPQSNAPNSKIVNSCRTIHNLARIMSGPRKNNKVTYKTPGPGITLTRSQARGRLTTIKTQRNNARLF